MTAIKVDIWSDIACPVVLHRQAALRGRQYRRSRAGDGVRSRSSSTASSSPRHSGRLRRLESTTWRQHKGLSADQVAPMLDTGPPRSPRRRPDYDFDALQHTNTVKAHQFAALRQGPRPQLEMKERLLGAYFVEGRTSGGSRTSPTSPPKSAWTATRCLRALGADEYLDAVHADQRRPSASASAACRSSSSTPGWRVGRARPAAASPRC